MEGYLIIETHQLDMVEKRTSQDTERKQQSKAHSRTRKCKGREKLEHGKKATKRGALTNWVGQREEQVRTQRERNRAMHTHRLSRAEGRTDQDKKGKKPREAHSLSGKGSGRDKSGHDEKATKQNVLTIWKRQRGGQVSAQR